MHNSLFWEQQSPVIADTASILLCSAVRVPGRAMEARVSSICKGQETEARRRHAHLLCGEALQPSAHPTRTR